MPFRSLLIAATATAALTATTAPALASPPPNDNYLASTALNRAGGPLPSVLTDQVDTTEATTQSDLFNPGPDGLPLGGDGPEPTQCHGTVFGKTVWWDFHPPVDGGVEIKTAAGFDSVVTIYQWSDQTSRIVRMIDCQNTPGPTEDLVLPQEVKGGRAYTIQVGGVSGPGGVIAGGPLSFELDFFADTDGDGFLDAEGDKCKTTPGPRGFGGCPPELNVAPGIKFNSTATGITITQLLVGHVPKGAKVRATCGGCHTVTTTAKRSTVEFKKLEGRSVRKGSKVQIRVTMGRHGKGKYRYGATGALITWPVKAGGIGTKRTQCLHVKTNKIQKCR
jgi:hypothetical protein